MSFFYGPDDSTNSSHSNTSFSCDGLPRICDDLNCSNPFGDTCDACTLALGLAEMSSIADEMDPGSRLEDWVNETLNNVGEYEEKTQTIASSTSSTSSTHCSVVRTIGSPNRRVIEHGSRAERKPRSTRATTNGETLDDIGEYNQKSQDKASSTCYITTTQSRVFPASRSRKIGTKEHKAQAVLKDEFTDTTTVAATPKRSSLNRRDMVDKWLTERLDRLEEHIFVGTTGRDGADEKDRRVDLQDPRCPLCDNPIGPAADQHLLKCIYAHEEMLKLQALEVSAAQ